MYIVKICTFNLSLALLTQISFCFRGSSKKRARLEKHETNIGEVGDDNAAPEPAQPLHEADVMDVGKDTTATPGPAQPLLPEREEEDQGEVLFREKADDNDEDEGVILNYE